MTTASPEQQLALLDLQHLDTTLNQLDHRRASFGEHARLVELGGAHDRLRDDVVRARTQESDLRREVTKAEQDVEQVRARAGRDQARLDSGQGGAKALEGLQHELESLGRRQSALEDIELEVMERLEEATSRAEALEAEQESTRAEMGTVTERLGELTAEVDGERSEVAHRRELAAAGIDDALLALYDKVRERVGTGAAALSQRRCGGCRLELTPIEIQRLRAAPADEVQRCEECSRILVRTAESGL